MEIEFVGAARTVTGSKHLVRTEARARCCSTAACARASGASRSSTTSTSASTPARSTAVVLSHAHIDHSGALPMLAKNGYDGPIFCTPATRDLCAAMLADAAAIQESDARYINKQIDRGDSDMERVEPLYDEDDVLRALDMMISVPYHRKLDDRARRRRSPSSTRGTSSAAPSRVLDVDEDGQEDAPGLHRRSRAQAHAHPQRPRVPAGRGRRCIMESTYGDRLHAPIEEMDAKLAEVLDRVYRRGGKVIIPSFALERAQEIVFALKALKRQGKMPPMPVYVDSPLTVKITDVFKLHPECFDEETRALISGSESPFDFDQLRYVSSVEDSKAIDADGHPAIVISASGMCEAGRIVHHLKASIEDPKNAVLIVGFQAPHTLGRRIVEQRQRVKIFGVERDLRAEVVVLNGFSAHADQKDLVRLRRRRRATGGG